jgi:hypothetical protein
MCVRGRWDALEMRDAQRHMHMRMHMIVHVHVVEVSNTENHDAPLVRSNVTLTVESRQ